MDVDVLEELASSDAWRRVRYIETGPHNWINVEALLHAASTIERSVTDGLVKAGVEQSLLR